MSIFEDEGDFRERHVQTIRGFWLPTQIQGVVYTASNTNRTHIVLTKTFVLSDKPTSIPDTISRWCCLGEDGAPFHLNLAETPTFPPAKTAGNCGRPTFLHGGTSWVRQQGQGAT